MPRDDERFDVVIVDLPDPNHPDLNRLYSDYFYARVRAILSPDGAIAIQSTSPYHAKEAFLSIGKTVAHAGFTVSQYHANVPSFGEWGWTLGTPTGKSGPERIAALDVGETPDGWLDGTRIAAAFRFPPRYFDVVYPTSRSTVLAATRYSTTTRKPGSRAGGRSTSGIRSTSLQESPKVSTE